VGGYGFGFRRAGGTSARRAGQAVGGAGAPGVHGGAGAGVPGGGAPYGYQQGYPAGGIDDRPGATRVFAAVPGDPQPGPGPDYGYGGGSSGHGGGAGRGRDTVPDPEAAGAAGYAAPGTGYPATGPGGPADGYDHVTTYRAGTPHPQVGTDRLHWRELLPGIYRRPAATFTQMRGYPVWGPALTVSAVYGVLATFGFGDTRTEILHSTFSTALISLISGAIGIVLGGLMLGAVTHEVARRLGGDGAWAPTIGLSMLVAWTTDAPRMLFALFLSPTNGVVQFLGWVTWLLCCWLLTSMVRQVHDLPWGKAAGAAALQLIALLVLIKLPTLS